MRREEHRGLAVLRFESMPDAVDQLVTTRRGGVSTGPYASLNLGLRVGDEPDAVLANRRRLFDAFELPLEDSVWCRQVHRDDVHVVTAQDAGRGALTEETIVADTDALVTELPGVPLCVTLADCVPVLLYDRDHHVIGLAHAGWGGTVAGIASRTVVLMAERYGSDPARVVAAIGPSISPARYEVGDDVVARAEAAYGTDAARILRPAGAPGKALFDLWEANVIDLERAGVPRAAVEVSGVSTMDDLDDFYSHRAERTTGRLIATVMLRER